MWLISVVLAGQPDVSLCVKCISKTYRYYIVSNNNKEITASVSCVFDSQGLVHHLTNSLAA